MTSFLFLHIRKDVHTSQWLILALAGHFGLLGRGRAVALLRILVTTRIAVAHQYYRHL